MPILLFLTIKCNRDSKQEIKVILLSFGIVKICAWV